MFYVPSLPGRPNQVQGLLRLPNPNRTGPRPATGDLYRSAVSRVPDTYRINRQSILINARVSSATLAWFYTTVVVVLTYLSSILSCLKAEKHDSDHIVMDTKLLPPHSSL